MEAIKTTITSIITQAKDIMETGRIMRKDKMIPQEIIGYFGHILLVSHIFMEATGGITYNFSYLPKIIFIIPNYMLIKYYTSKMRIFIYKSKANKYLELHSLNWYNGIQQTIINAYLAMIIYNLKRATDAVRPTMEEWLRDLTQTKKILQIKYSRTSASPEQDEAFKKTASANTIKGSIRKYVQIPFINTNAIIAEVDTQTETGRYIERIMIKVNDKMIAIVMAILITANIMELRFMPAIALIIVTVLGSNSKAKSLALQTSLYNIMT